VLAVDAEGYRFVRKDPNAILDYLFDWAALTNARRGAQSDWLGSGDTLSAISVSADSGLTVGDGINGAAAPAITDAGTSVTVWLLGGTAGTTYDVRCRVTTVAGRTDDRTLRVQVMER
jgi:hypothetical protein